MPDAILLFARPFLVKETVPAGATASNAVPGAGSGGTKQSNTSILVQSTTNGNTYQPNDFLVCVPPTTVNICGNVYNDLDNSNTITGGDAKVPNVTIKLTTPGTDGNCCTGDDTVVATTTTDASGHYCFMGMPPGTYGVQETVPSGFTAVGSFPGAGSGALRRRRPVSRWRQPRRHHLSAERLPDQGAEGEYLRHRVQGFG